jgi:hypothetical protein
MMDITISVDMGIYDHLLSTSVDTLSTVKKADALVVKHEAKMQTAEASLKSAQDLLSPKEWKALISGLDMAPFRAVSPAREEEEHNRSRDRTPASMTKSVAFVEARPPSPTPPLITAATTITQAPHARTEGSNSKAPKKPASVALGVAPRSSGNAAAQQDGRNSTESRLLSRVRCYNCGNLGHYATDCPEPRKPRSETPAPSRFDKSKTTHPDLGQTMSHGQTQDGQRTASVAKPSSNPHVMFGGVDYWAG